MIYLQILLLKTWSIILNKVLTDKFGSRKTIWASSIIFIRANIVLTPI